MENLFELNRAYLENVSHQLESGCAHPKQGPILCLLLACDGVSQADIKRKLNVSAATVAVSIGRLVRLGYVRRRRNPSHPRAYILSLTQEGRMQAEKLKAAIEATCETAALGISDTEMKQLSGTIHRITNNLQRMEYRREA